MHSLEEKLARYWPPGEWRQTTVLAAVSGGPDSLALVRALLAQGPEPGMLAVAHFNHGLRGAESEADEQFVAEFARQWGLPHVAARARETPHSAGEGLEAVLRQQRYAFLESAAASLGARYVVTGHTADDQAETVLHRIFRGTGLAGLAGMPRARPLGPVSLLRPLLFARRSEVLHYLTELGQTFRVDSSNADPRFSRNWLRRELLPRILDGYGPQAVDSVLRLSEVAAEAQQLIRPMAIALLRRVARSTGNAAVQIDLAPLVGQPGYLVREMFVALWEERGWPLGQMGHARWRELAEFAQGTAISEENRSVGGAMEWLERASMPNLPGAIQVTKQGGKLLLSRPG